jgi:hypothetical protein
MELAEKLLLLHLPNDLLLLWMWLLLLVLLPCGWLSVHR